MASYTEIYDSLKNDPDKLQRDIAEAVRVSQDDVLTSMMRQAQLFMEWGYLQVLAEMDAKKARIQWEEVELPQCKAIAETRLKEAGEKFTVDRKLDMARQMPDYLTAYEHYLVALERSMIFAKVVDALRQKKDMIQSLNSRQRVELGAIQHERVPGGNSFLHDEPADVPTVDPSNEGRPQNDVELEFRLQTGIAAYRKKRKIRLLEKHGEFR